MNTTEISLSCPSRAHFTADNSGHYRAIAVAIGIIFVVGAALVLSRSINALNQVPPWAGYAAGALGVVVIAIACCLKVIRKEEVVVEPLPPKPLKPRLSDAQIQLDKAQVKGANQLLSTGNGLEALDKVRKILDPYQKDRLLATLLQTGIDSRLTTAARAQSSLQLIAEIHDIAIKENTIFELANQKHDQQNIVDFVKGCCPDPRMQERIILRLADHAYKKAQENDAARKIAPRLPESDYQLPLQLVKGIESDRAAKDAMLLKLAQSFFDRKDYQGAWETLKEIKSNLAAAQELSVRIAQTHFDRGDLQGSLEVAQEIGAHDLILKIANAHLDKDQYDLALTAARAIPIDSQKEYVAAKEVILVKIAEHYLETQYRRAAFELAKEILQDVAAKEALFLKIAMACLTQSEDDLALEVFKEIAPDTSDEIASSDLMGLVTTMAEERKVQL